MCLKNSISSVIKPDPKLDDSVLAVDDSGIESQAPPIDNFSGNSKVNKIIKIEQIPEDLDS